ncbi:MAG: hypothetical protein Q4D91_09100 [Lautropia sp.]|nr:hypothetical protein [Lautropia sp.]
MGEILMIGASVMKKAKGNKKTARALALTVSRDDVSEVFRQQLAEPFRQRNRTQKSC